jgi:hypothetical protein
MARGRRPSDGQGALFQVPAAGFLGSISDVVHSATEPVSSECSGPVIRPWDPVDQADTEVGWQYRYVTPRRAIEIRQEIEHGDR